ncbi:MAG TPA: hypothetical protein VGL89_08770 [Candidatus Koribacter sp.]|jgi:hypothetical protein
MQAVRSIVERFTAAIIQPLVTLGVSAAIATAVMELLRDVRLIFSRD